MSPRVTVNHGRPDGPELLARQYPRERRPADRDRIAASYEWLVGICARRARWHDESVDDLSQVARLGLLSAIERFDPDRGVSFRTFAEVTMMGTIRHHHRSALPVTVPRAAQDLNVACRSAVERLTSSLKRTPTSAEVADHLGIGQADAAAALAVDHLFHLVSLSSSDSGEGDPTVEKCLCTDDSCLESTAERAEIQHALTELPDTQRTILFLHFYEGRTQAEIGARLGISQVQVSRMMAAALCSMRAVVSPPDHGDGTIVEEPPRRRRRATRGAAAS